jgi:hypothetical protein
MAMENAEPKQIGCFVFLSAELGGKIMGRTFRLARQYEANGNFDLWRIAQDMRDLFKFAGRVGCKPPAAIGLERFGNLMPGLYRIVIVKFGPRRRLAHSRHFLQRSHIPHLDAGFGQAAQNLVSRI